MRAVLMSAGATVDVYCHRPVRKRLPVDHDRGANARRLAKLLGDTPNRRSGNGCDRGSFLRAIVFDLLLQSLEGGPACDSVDLKRTFQCRTDSFLVERQCRADGLIP